MPPPYCCYENNRSRSTLACSSWRSRTRLLATRVWARRSSVDDRIATHGPCHLHDRPTRDLPAVQCISRRTQPASLRGALPSSRNRSEDGSHATACSCRRWPANGQRGSSARRIALLLEPARKPTSWSDFTLAGRSSEADTHSVCVLSRTLSFPGWPGRICAPRVCEDAGPSYTEARHAHGSRALVR